MADHLREVTKKIDFISREAALDFLIPTDDLNISAQDQWALGDRFEEFLKSIPAADVVEVVRCRDCRYDHACLTQQFVEENSKIPFNRDEFFCPDGKRREPND